MSANSTCVARTFSISHSAPPLPALPDVLQVSVGNSKVEAAAGTHLLRGQRPDREKHTSKLRDYTQPSTSSFHQQASGPTIDNTKTIQFSVSDRSVRQSPSSPVAPLESQHTAKLASLQTNHPQPPCRPPSLTATAALIHIASNRCPHSHSKQQLQLVDQTLTRNHSWPTAVQCPRVLRHGFVYFIQMCPVPAPTPRNTFIMKRSFPTSIRGNNQ